MMDRVIRMVSSCAVRCVFFLSLIKVNILAARLASIRTNRVKMVVFISIASIAKQMLLRQVSAAVSAGTDYPVYSINSVIAI